jgi:hypothetical protein
MSTPDRHQSRPSWASNDEAQFERRSAVRACYNGTRQPAVRSLYGWMLAMVERIDAALPILDGLAGRAGRALERLGLCLAKRSGMTAGAPQRNR